jgi:hypothetical protein
MTEDEIHHALDAVCKDAAKYIRESLQDRGLTGCANQVYATIMLLAVTAAARMPASEDMDTVKQFAIGIKLCRKDYEHRPAGATLQ